MSYTNPRHESRLIIIPHLRDAFASLHVNEAPPGATAMEIEGDNSLVVFQLDEVGSGCSGQLIPDTTLSFFSA
jgi:hypothetical protein